MDLITEAESLFYYGGGAWTPYPVIQAKPELCNGRGVWILKQRRSLESVTEAESIVHNRGGTWIALTLESIAKPVHQYFIRSA